MFYSLQAPQTVAEFPAEMQNLLSLLKNFDALVFKETHLAVCSPLEILRAVSKNKITFSQRYVSLNQHFQRVRSGYVISAPAFSNVLGDIFMNMAVKHSVQTMTPLEKQRIVLTLKSPAEALKNGATFDDISAQALQFYIQLRGLRLHGCCYDDCEESICDYSDGSEQGYGSQL